MRVTRLVGWCAPRTNTPSTKPTVCMTRRATPTLKPEIWWGAGSSPLLAVALRCCSVVPVDARHEARWLVCAENEHSVNQTNGLHDTTRDPHPQTGNLVGCWERGLTRSRIAMLLGSARRCASRGSLVGVRRGRTLRQAKQG